MIEVRLFAWFRDGREKIVYLSAEEFGTVETILKHLDIAVKDVAILLVNGRHNKPEAQVAAGDIVALFPPVAGG